MGFLKIIASAGVLGCVLISAAYGEYNGRFVGKVTGTFLDEVEGRPRLQLISDFAFEDPNGLLWEVPAGTIVDGASIPEFFWPIASPFAGDYLWASVIHDYYCDMRIRTAHDTHRNFFYGMLTKGVDRTMADIMYWVVGTYGPQWDLESPPIDLDDPVVAAAAKAKTAAVVRTLQWSDGKYIDVTWDGEYVPATPEGIFQSASYYRQELATGRFLSDPQRMGAVALWSDGIALGGSGFDPQKSAPLQAWVTGGDVDARASIVVNSTTTGQAANDWLAIEAFAQSGSK